MTLVGLDLQNYTICEGRGSQGRSPSITARRWPSMSIFCRNANVAGLVGLGTRA